MIVQLRRLIVNSSAQERAARVRGHQPAHPARGPRLREQELPVPGQDRGVHLLLARVHHLQQPPAHQVSSQQTNYHMSPQPVIYHGHGHG